MTRSCGDSIFRNTMLFSRVATPFTSPPAVGTLLFSTPTSAFVICVLFDDSCSDRCEMIANCGSDLHFPRD